ncbi:class II myosin, partial [Coemansia sp. RSA 2167]
MTMLSKITNESINDNLKMRFENADIYTYIGNVLISVNPFKDLGIYTPQVLKSYENKNRMELAPHVYAIAEGAFRNMIAYSEDQCVIISGESGAGKTEAAKKIMEYIAAVSGGNSSSIKEIKDMVLATNPLLESFGCAKTLRNNNSSRHGKYLEIQFNAGGEPVGAMITNYLLEKNRVVGQIQNERNFHIFYQFTKSASDEYRQNFGISGPENFLYTSKAGCLDVPNMYDSREYADTLKAMSVIGISTAEQDQIHRMLAAILWLGNVQFVPHKDDDNMSQITDPDITAFIAYLLESTPELVSKVLVSRTIETPRGGRRGSVYDVPLNIAQAESARNGLAKAIYDRLFDWIVMRVNQAMQARGEARYIIGVLDIYGFEIFDHNSFEQLCINYVNEKLQQIFIELTLKAEQEEYVREKIEWTPIDYFNNKVVCDLIEAKRPPGVFAAMNDACATAHADPKAADQSLSQRLTACSHSKHFALYDGNFTVKHYAGDVTYMLSGMTDKNKDQLLRDHLELCKGSSNSFLQTLFPEDLAQDSKRRPPTASDRIKVSANELVTKLMQSQPSYIRTIKPNENKSPSEFDVKRVLHQ